MAGKIKGISISIGAETKDLNKALSEIGKQVGSMNKELKQVDNLLKFDPNNTVLLAQKQEILGNQIATTATKLDALKQAQAEVERQFANGEIGEEAYRSFQRELINTEGVLGGLQNKLAGIQVEQDKVADSTRQLSTFFEATGTSIDDFSDALGTRLVTAIKEGKATSQQLEQALTAMGRQALGAEADIDRMRDALRNVDSGGSLREVRQDFADISREAENAESQVKELGDGMKTALSGLATAGGVAAVTGLVDGMTEANQALGMLEVQANNAGIAIDSIGEGKVALSSVNHDANQIAETMGNLMQAGYDNAESINQISEALAGAKVKYGETFSGEGLAESITTTTQLGEVTGQLTDLLEKEGVNVDDFNAKMQSLATTEERANYISQLLAEQGLNGMYQEYAKLNPELVANAEATTENESAMAELATALTPIATMITDIVTSIVEWVNNNEGLALALASISLVIGAVTTVLMALAPIISTVTTIVPILTTAIGAVSAPVLAAVAAFAALVAGGVLLWQNWDTVKEKAGQLKDWIGTKFNELKDSATKSIQTLKENGINKFNELTTALKNKVTGAKDSVVTAFENLRAGVVNKVTSAKDTAISVFENLKSNVISRVSSIVSSVQEKFSAAKTAITKPIEEAKNTVKTVVDTIKGFFTNLKLPEIKIPKIKLPKFSIKGEFGINPPRVPTFGIEWFAKGGLMTKPTAFGMNGNNVMVGGEAGREAILPLTANVLAGIGKGIETQMKASNQSQVIHISPAPIILDGQVIAEATFNTINSLQYANVSLNAMTKGVRI